MAGTTNHDYHILPPDIWPLIGSISALVFTSGMVLYMHEMANAYLVLGLGIAGLIATFWSWFGNIVTEAEAGHHTPVVQLHMRYGMILFIASEVMFFVGWFWSWFDFALFPSALSDVVGGVLPPEAIEAVIDPFSLPLLNTLDPAVFGHDGHLGAPLADPRRSRRAEEGPVGDDHSGRGFQRHPGL